MKSTARRLLVACLLVAATAPGPVSRAHAIDSSQTVQALHRSCKSAEGSSPYDLCLGFIAGVGDAMQLLGFGVEQKPEFAPFAICSRPSYGTMVQAFVDWAEQNPGKSDSNRIVGVMTALRANWPCKPHERGG